MQSKQVKTEKIKIGVILAAGTGYRLRPLTENQPKCLVPVSGKPLLAYQIDSYRTAGIDELIVVVGYQGDAVRAYCSKVKDLKITIVENMHYASTNNMYSLYLASSLLYGHPFILNNADLAIDTAIVKEMIESCQAGGVAVDMSTYNEESMKIEVNNKNYITNISKNIPQNTALGCSIDFYKFTANDSVVFFKEISKIIEEEANVDDWTEVALQRLFASQALKFTPIDITGYAWVEVDNHEDLAIAESTFA